MAFSLSKTGKYMGLNVTAVFIQQCTEEIDAITRKLGRGELQEKFCDELIELCDKWKAIIGKQTTKTNTQ